MSVLLQLENVHSYYGNIHALKGISMTVEEGEIIALIGANGAGKTTALNTVSGVLHPRQGRILLQGRDIAGVPPYDVVSLGISQVPEGRKVFAVLTVDENLDMGAYLRKDKAGIRKSKDEIYDLFPVLAERHHQLAGTLSGGEQQMLAIGRGLMSMPKLMLLDEPSLGVAPLIVRAIFKIIKEINTSGTTVLLVEQNARMALRLANHGYCLETGRIAISGNSEELLSNEMVKKAYLGG